jgi:hypothetical protein
MYLKPVLQQMLHTGRSNFDADDHPIGSLIALRIANFEPDKSPLPVDRPGITGAEVKRLHGIALDPGLWFEMLCNVPSDRRAEEKPDADDVDMEEVAQSDDVDVDSDVAEESNPQADDAVDDESEPFEEADNKEPDATACMEVDTSVSSAPSSGKDDDIEIVHVDDGVKKQNSKLVFASEGRFLFGFHMTASIHDAAAITHMALSEDLKWNRNTARITTEACVRLLFEILYHSSVGMWNCIYCPVGIAKRCHEIYFMKKPDATDEDHVFSCLAHWIVEELDQFDFFKYVEAIKFLPMVDYPEIINPGAPHKGHDRRTYGELIEDSQLFSLTFLTDKFGIFTVAVIAETMLRFDSIWKKTIGEEFSDRVDLMIHNAFAIVGDLKAKRLASG